MSTMGELYDRLKAIKEAEDDIKEAERMLRFGGSPTTVTHKQEAVEFRQSLLEDLRKELIVEEE